MRRGSGPRRGSRARCRTKCDTSTARRRPRRSACTSGRSLGATGRAFRGRGRPSTDSERARPFPAGGTSRAAYDELYRQRSRAGGEWASRSAEEVYNSFIRKEPLRHQPWGEERGAAGKHDTDRRCDGRQEQGRTAGQLDLLFTASQIATPGEGATNMREATARDDCYDVYNRTRVEGEQQMMALV